METPLVTISLVSFNQATFLRQAIGSCIMQEVDFRYEIIIHDDASPDNSSTIIEEYAKKYPDLIIPIIQKKNQFSQGIEVNVQCVLPKAKGKYIAFLEADDYWIDPLKLEKQVNFLERNPEVMMCFTATKRIFPGTSKEPQIFRYKNHDSICSIKDVIRLGGSLVDMGSAVVRRTIYDQIPDWYFFTQTWDSTVPLLSLLNGKIQYLDQVTAVYRYNVPGSWTQRNVKEYERRRINRKKNIMVLEGFDQQTDYKYHKYVKRRKNPIIVEVLLLSDENADDFSDLYPQLSSLSKLEYRFFTFIRSFKLWEIYRTFKHMLTGF